MNNQDVFREMQESQNEFLNTIREDAKDFIIRLDRREDGFSKAIDKFVTLNEVDADYIKIDPDIARSLDKENAHKGARKKKNNAQTVLPNGVSIKKEKISDSYTSADSTCSVDVKVDHIKVEKEDMPAPSFIPPKRKGKTIKVERASSRNTRTKGKKEPTSNSRDSDVVVQNLIVPVVNLCDSEDCDQGKAQKQETSLRSTRSKAIKAKADPPPSSNLEKEAETGVNKEQDKSEEVTNQTETRSTRTKTLRKEKKVEEEPEVKQQEVRSTRTKTIRKGHKEPDNVEEVADVEQAVEHGTRSTRTKTVKKADDNPDNVNNNIEVKNLEVQRSTRTKTRRQAEKEVQPDETNTIVTDAAPQTLNTTYVTTEAKTVHPPILNTTVTITSPKQALSSNAPIMDKPKFNIFNKTDEAFLSNDDSTETTKTPPRKQQPVKAAKEVFSPYEKTTLKKKVEAFEKLQNGGSDKLAKANNINIKPSTPSVVKEKAKLFTPLASTFMPTSSSTSKISRLISHQHSSANNESLLAMKSAQKDSRDRQRRLLDREQALMKKEAKLQAQAEAKRKINEERQLKAQQQRKALEAEKLKQLELQKLKEERLKQREIEREEYLMKQKLEAEKKRLAQKKKIQELQAQREQVLAEQNRNPPVYMTSKAPILPTADCYDSDDANYRTVKPPSWCSEEHSRTVQLAMLAAGDKIKNTLFCRQPQTPDLKEIFEVIDPAKLKRSSSILWRKPPRYTMMPDLNETKFSEDDEMYESA